MRESSSHAVFASATHCNALHTATSCNTLQQMCLLVCNDAVEFAHTCSAVCDIYIHACKWSVLQHKFAWPSALRKWMSFKVHGFGKFLDSLTPLLFSGSANMDMPKRSQGWCAGVDHVDVIYNVIYNDRVEFAHSGLQFVDISWIRIHTWIHVVICNDRVEFAHK